MPSEQHVWVCGEFRAKTVVKHSEQLTLFFCDDTQHYIFQPLIFVLMSQLSKKNSWDEVPTSRVDDLLSPSASSLSSPARWRGSWPPRTQSPTGRRRRSWPTGRCPPPWCRRPSAWRRWPPWWWWTWSAPWWCLQVDAQGVKFLFFFLKTSRQNMFICIYAN